MMFKELVTRRKFLEELSHVGIGVFAVSATASLFNHSFAAGADSSEWFLAPYTPDQENIAEAKISDLALTNLSSGESGKIPLSFRGHGTIKHPKKAWTVLVFPQRGGMAAEVDIKSRKVSKQIAAETGQQFYGHGIFSDDGSTLFSTEINLKNGSGILAIRDSMTYKVIGKYETGGFIPHDVKLINNGKTLIVANAAPKATDKTSLAYIDIHSGKILENPSTDFPKASFAHLALATGGEIFISTTPIDNKMAGRVFIRTPGKAIEVLPLPDLVLAKVEGQALSLAIDNQRGIVGVTIPQTGRVLFWNFHERKFLKQIEMPRPCGMVLNQAGTHYIVSIPSGVLQIIDAKTLVTVSHPTAINHKLMGGNISHASLINFG